MGWRIYVCGCEGSSVIDYSIVNESAQERVIEFRIGEKMNSDHLPLTLLLEEEENMKQIEMMTEKEEKEQNMLKRIICWNEEARKLYRERTEVWNENEDQEIELVDGKWKKIKNRIFGALEYKIIKMKKRRKIGHKD